MPKYCKWVTGLWVNIIEYATFFLYEPLHYLIAAIFARIPGL
jgi:hypothetical protein